MGPVGGLLSLLDFIINGLQALVAALPIPL